MPSGPQSDNPGHHPDHPAAAGSGPDELAVTLSELARSLQQQPDPESTLVEVVHAAVALIPGVDEGSISVVLGRRRVTSQAASSDLPRAVDAIQEETGQGPCLDAVYEQETVRVPDMASEQRWPLFAARAAAAGAAAMLSFQLFVEGDNLGALNLYSREANGFDQESEHVGLLFAAHASIAYAGARTQSELGRAILSRQVIGQAQGILIERHQLTSEQAFTVLVRASQDANIKLREMAERLVQTGQLPVAGPRGARSRQR